MRFNHVLLSIRIIILTLLWLPLSSCSLFDVVNAFDRDKSSTVQRDLSYGTHPRHQLDFYSPLHPADDAVFFVFFYGGGWESGDRADYEFVARTLADEGHFVAIPDYRLYPEVTFPTFVYDGALAAAFILEHLTAAIEPNISVFLIGHSAGAHIAMLLALDERYLAEYGWKTEALSGVVGLSGPYDFLPMGPHLEKIFPSPVKKYDSQPIHFVDSEDLPVLLIHGDRDRRVLPSNSVNMAAALSRNGGEVTLKVYSNITHIGVIKPFTPFFKDSIGLLGEIQEFVLQVK